MPEERDILARLEALEAAQPKNALRLKPTDGHHHMEPVEGMDDAASQGFGYQLNAIGGLTLTRAAAPNNRRLDLKGGGMMNVDYVVDPAGGGSHTTLTSAVADAIAAATNKTIWICSSPDAEDAIDLGGLGSSQTITVASHSQYSVILTAKANDDIFKQDSIGGNTAGGLQFRNLGFSIPSADYAIYYVNTISEMTSLSFDECRFSGKYLARQTGNANPLTAVTLRVADCTGSLDGFFDQTHTSQAAPDALVAYNNELTLTAWWDGGSGDSCPDFVNIDGGRYTINNALNIGNAMDRVLFQNFWLSTGVAAALFTTGAASQNIDDLGFRNLTCRFTHADGRFGNFGSRDTTGQNDTLTVIDVVGYRDSGATSTETFLTIDTDWKNPYVSGLWAPDWATLYSGPVTDMDPIHSHSNLQDSYNGTFIQPFTFVVTSNGTTITGTLDKNPSGDLTQRFSDGFSTFSSGGTVTLTAGSDTSPNKRFVYILQSAKTTLVEAASWPAAEHIKVAEVVIQSASTVQSDGPLANRFWNDPAMDTASQGHHTHAWERVRWEHSAYFSGSAVTWTITTNAGAIDNIDLAITAGKVYQLHLQDVSAFDTTTPASILVPNDSGTAYTATADIEDLLTDSAGGSMSGKYFNLVVWCSVSSGSETERVFINLPGGSYNKQADATSDVSGFDNYTIPTDFRGYAFLVNRITLRHQAAANGTFTNIQEVDLRGQVPNVVAGGGTAAITTEFADNAFKLFDDGDPTKQLAFQVSSVSASTTREITVPDEDVTLIDDGTSDPLIDGAASDGSEGSLARKDHVHPLHHAQAHKDEHDPNDGADALDSANAAEVSVVVAAGTGTSHSLARADHIHAINHAITDNHLVTVDGSPNDDEYARFTANGLEGRTEAEFKADYNLQIGTDVLAEQTVGIADDNLLEVDDADAADNDFAKFTANGLEGRSSTEVVSDLGIEFSMAITVENPGSSEDLTIKRTDAAITVQEIHAVLRGSATPSVTWTIRHQPAGTGSGRGATGNEVVTSGTTTTSVTAGDDVTSFNDATIPADSFVWLETTAKSGTVNELHVTIRSTFD